MFYIYNINNTFIIRKSKNKEMKKGLFFHYTFTFMNPDIFWHSCHTLSTDYFSEGIILRLKIVTFFPTDLFTPPLFHLSQWLSAHTSKKCYKWQLLTNLCRQTPVCHPKQLVVDFLCHQLAPCLHFYTVQFFYFFFFNLIRQS